MWFVVFCRHLLYLWAFVFSYPIVFAMAEGRFRLPKTIQEEELSVERAESKSTRYKNKWAESTFEDWQRVQSVKFPILEVDGVFKEYKLHKVQPLTVPVTDIDALTLNYWLSKLFNLFKRSVCNLKCFSWPFFIKNQWFVLSCVWAIYEYAD